MRAVEATLVVFGAVSGGLFGLALAMIGPLATTATLLGAVVGAAVGWVASDALY